MGELNTSIQYLSGVGPKRAELLRRELGIETLSDLIHLYPFRYIDRSGVTPIAQIAPPPALALIDGNRSAGIETPARCVVKGDATCADIAAASILAKVTRDRYMLELAAQYPQYGFEQHKGYGTAAHYASLRAYGPSPVHRPSFLRKMH